MCGGCDDGDSWGHNDCEQMHPARGIGWMTKEQMTPIPPPDAVVKEAVEEIEEDIEHAALHDLNPTVDIDRLRTLLSYVRAVQAPRLTAEQVEILREAEQEIAICARRDFGRESKTAPKMRALFPEVFAGEVGRG